MPERSTALMCTSAVSSTSSIPALVNAIATACRQDSLFVPRLATSPDGATSSRPRPPAPDQPGAAHVAVLFARPPADAARRGRPRAPLGSDRHHWIQLDPGLPGRAVGPGCPRHAGRAEAAARLHLTPQSAVGPCTESGAFIIDEPALPERPGAVADLLSPG